MKNLVLHFNFIKAKLEESSKTVQELSDLMKEEFGTNYKYVWNEVQELIALKKIEEVKYNNKRLLVWTAKPIQFEYELEHNVVQIDKQYCEFITVPSKVRQMKLPLYVLNKMKEQISCLDENIQVMVQIKAIKNSDGVWHKIQKR